MGIFTNNFLQPPVLGNGLVCWWRFNENKGTALNDYSNNNNNGIITNPISNNWTRGLTGYGLSFNGSGQYIICNNQSIINGAVSASFTISTWMYFYSLPTGNVYPNEVSIYDQGPAASSLQNAFYVGSTTLRFCASDVNNIININHSLTTNKWYMLTCVKNGSLWNIYQNNTSLGNAPYYSPLPTYALHFEVCDDDYGANNKFNGIIDEYRIYNRALSQQEITTLYKSSL